METIFTQTRVRKCLPLFYRETLRSNRRFFAVVVLLIAGVLNTYAQAPNITYASPLVYTFGTGIAPRSATNTGGAVPPKTVIFASGVDYAAGLAVDSAGDIYYSEGYHGNIKKLPAGGGAAVVVASGFLNPTRITRDTAGNIYVADYSNHAVKEIPTGGGATITLNSGFNGPYGVAVDPAGNVYVTDFDGNTLTKIPAGNGTPVVLASGLNRPSGVALDASGNVYVVEYGLDLIKVAAGTNTVTTVYTASLTDVQIDRTGNLYVSSSENGTITELTSGGSVLAVVPGYPGALAITLDATANIFLYSLTTQKISAVYKNAGYTISPALPFGLNFDLNTGVLSGTPLTEISATNFTVTGTNNSGSSATTVNIAIKLPTAPKISYSSPQSYTVGAAISALSPVNTGGAFPPVPLLTLPGTYKDTRAVAFDTSGNVYIADRLNTGIWEIPKGGHAVLNLGTGIIAPTGVAVDAAGNIYVADSKALKIKKISAGSGTTAPVASGFGSPYGIALDGHGYMYVTDATNNEVDKIPVGGGTHVVVGTGFNHPTGIALDAAGNVYVADQGSKSIKKILASDGSTVTVSATGAEPSGVAVDAEGNVYYTNHFLFKIPANGGSNVELSLGFSNALSLGVAVDKYDNIYAGDTQNLLLREIQVGRYLVTPTLPAGLSLNTSTGVISGTPTAVSPLTTYTIKAQNPGGSGTAALNVKVVSADNNLSFLKISAGTLSPVFAGATTSYSASVGNAVSSITVTPTTADTAARVTVNGIAVMSKTASGPIALSVGTNTITIVVTGPNGVSTQTYTVTVTRAPSTNANLTSIGPSVTPLTPTFTASNTSYTLSVPYSTATMTVKPMTGDPNATMKVNGASLASGATSAPIALAEGATTAINIVVTAQDGTTVKTYTITVTRGPSTNASLASMNPSITPLTPTFTPATTSYTLNVANSVSSITVRPVSNDAHATITVNGTANPSGTTSAPIALAVGSNAISVVVTAQDGTTTRTYTITVTRASGGADSFSDGISVSKPTETPVLAEDGILVHEAISPNGDGINDFLQIENINQYPDNKLTIMNRSGQLIYEAKGYDNNSKTFDGHSNKNGQMQLPGTYFYQLDYTVGGIIKHKTGFIVLKY